MDKRILIGAEIAILAGAGMVAWLELNYSTERLPVPDRAELVTMSKVAGLPDQPRYTDLKPLDLAVPVRLAIGGWVWRITILTVNRAIWSRRV